MGFSLVTFVGRVAHPYSTDNRSQGWAGDGSDRSGAQSTQGRILECADGRGNSDQGGSSEALFEWIHVG